MDTTRIEIVGKEIQRFTEDMSNLNTGLNTGEIALIASFIGASAAILAQVVMFILNKNKENSKFLVELIADERRLSLIITAYYNELIACGVSKHYWYQCAQMSAYSESEKKEFYSRSLYFDEKTHEAQMKFNLQIAEYLKVITHFLRFTNNTELIKNEFEKVINFKPRDPDRFNGIFDVNILEPLAFQEKQKLKIIYQFYNECFDKIHQIILNTK